MLSQHISNGFIHENKRKYDENHKILSSCEYRDLFFWRVWIFSDDFIVIYSWTYQPYNPWSDKDIFFRNIENNNIF